jgi:glycosidase
MQKAFTPTDWASGANIYEVNVRQYTPEGNFKGFMQHLPRLRDMGVEILWLMPITPISVKERQGSLGSYYACSTYTDINPEYGKLEDFKVLVEEAHRLGFKLIIDWVANHTGYDHHWTTEHPDWYKKDDQGNFVELNGWADVIDLDYHSKPMREEMIKAMQFWVKEYDIDGFRCDMAHLVPLDFWEEARTACDEIKPLFWLAESDVLHYHPVFDATYCWHWMAMSEKFIKEKATLDDVRDILMEYAQYPEGSLKLFFTTNHDENSWNGTEYEKYRYVAQAFAVFTATWTGLPLIYSGQEMPNHKRLKFFDHDPIEWTGNFQLHNFYSTLLQLRRQNAALHAGAALHELITDQHDKLMAYIRHKDGQVILVLLNLGNEDRLKVQVSHQLLKGKFRNVFTGLDFELDEHNLFELQSGEYLVYEKI